MKKMSMKDVSPELISAVSAWLLSKVKYDLEKQKMDQLDKELLEDLNVYMADDFVAHLSDGERKDSVVKDENGLRIIEPKIVYMASEESAAKFYEERSNRIQKMGYKIDKEHCPALIAEGIKMECEQLIINASCKILGLGDGEDWKSKLLCHSNGLETHKKWIELCVGLVVNLPGYESPLKKK
jgi:hypothetical protein